jgi:hypothetical protein
VAQGVGSKFKPQERKIKKKKHMLTRRLRRQSLGFTPYHDVSKDFLAKILFNQYIMFSYQEKSLGAGDVAQW